MSDVIILLATYNGEEYLSELLQSLEVQSYKNWELLVSDDCSKDSTIKILETFKQKSSHKITIIKNIVPFGSAKKNFMNLLKNELCNNKYIMFCDQDDIWKRDKIEKTLELMNDGKIPTLIYSDLLVVNNKLEIISNSFFEYTGIGKVRESFAHCIIQNNIPGCTMMINSSLRELAIEYENIDHIIMHDWWILLIAKCFGEVKLLNESTILYRQHCNNSVGAQKYSILNIYKKLAESNTRQLINLTIIQANEFNDCFKKKIVDMKHRVLLEKYSELLDSNKIKRLYIYIKYGIWKKGILRKLGQIIFG